MTSLALPKTSRSPYAARSPWGVRLSAGVAALAILFVLVLAARLSPDPKGHGTHTQLGLPPCTWAAYLERPCPTCGMTTAFAHAAHLQFWDSIKAQPFGALLAVFSAALFWACAHVAATGSRALAMVGGIFKGWTWWLLGLLFIASWLYKIAVWQA